MEGHMVMLEVGMRVKRNFQYEGRTVTDFGWTMTGYGRKYATLERDVAYMDLTDKGLSAKKVRHEKVKALFQNVKPDIRGNA